MNKINRHILVIVICLSYAFAKAQTDAAQIKKIYDTALTQGNSYQWLDHLSNQIGSRLSGSLGAELAVEWTKTQLDSIGLDKVWLQPVMVPKWIRGAKEYAYIEAGLGQTTQVPICALGGSIATHPNGLKAEVVEVKGIEELKAMNPVDIKGKIVFYNRPMQANLILTKGADLLSTMLKLNPETKFYYSMFCRNLPDVESYNVIGEITGSTYPDKYMVVGGHLDSWDLGDGSHDDGAGVVQSMEVVRLMKKIGYRPKHSIRVVLFMNEENGLRGGKKYASEAKKKGEKHVFALESDLGGFTPRGFTFDSDDRNFGQVLSWKPLFEPYLIHYFVQGGSGADIGPLKKEDNGIVLAGLRPDTQRYFDHHHAANDTFDAVNRRELELGSATMASLIYMMDNYIQKPAIKH